VPNLHRRVTYATHRYFANKELHNRVNTRGDRRQECRYCRRVDGCADDRLMYSPITLKAMPQDSYKGSYTVPTPPPPRLCCSQWD